MADRHSICVCQIAEEVEIQLQNYKKAVEEINQKTVQQPAQGSVSDDGPIETQNLMAAVSSLPELTEKKKVLDKHTSIATALLNIIKARFSTKAAAIYENHCCLCTGC